MKNSQSQTLNRVGLFATDFATRKQNRSNDFENQQHAQVEADTNTHIDVQALASSLDW